MYCIVLKQWANKSTFIFVLICLFTFHVYHMNVYLLMGEQLPNGLVEMKDQCLVSFLRISAYWHTYYFFFSFSILSRYFKLIYQTKTTFISLGVKTPTSLITFTCDELTDKGQPFLINNVQGLVNQYVFHWRTSLACPPSNVITTVTFKSKVIDLKNIVDNGKSLSTEDKR